MTCRVTAPRSCSLVCALSTALVGPFPASNNWLQLLSSLLEQVVGRQVFPVRDWDQGIDRTV